MDCRSFNKSISVIGTGDFGRAIGKRLITSGYDVTFGSRRPAARRLSSIDPAFAHVKITSVEEALRANRVIVLAIRVSSFEEIAPLLQKDAPGKIVVDVSNRSKSVRVPTSNAEFLQKLVPDVTVVKAFNVVSAYAMDSDIDGSSRMVPIASDDCRARQVVKDIARDIGFQPYDAGMLDAAKNMEMFVIGMFPMWRFPLLTALALFILWWLYCIYLFYIRANVYDWEQLFVKVLNKPLCMTAISIMALTYLPGCLAGYLQLINGTKHKRFPNWLDFWMKSRKQLGLVCFALACAHALLSAMILCPTYFPSWFHVVDVIVPMNMTSDVQIRLPATIWMTWKGEISCLTGILTLLLLCPLAVTSLPTVADSLNWAEWRFIQSKLGIASLFLAISHVYVQGVPTWILFSDFVAFLHSFTFTSSLLPMAVLVMRLVLELPFIRGHLRKIRRGWERNSASDEETGTTLLDVDVSEDKSHRNESRIPLNRMGGNEDFVESKPACVTNRASTECCQVGLKEANCGGGEQGGRRSYEERDLCCQALLTPEQQKPDQNFA